MGDAARPTGTSTSRDAALVQLVRAGDMSAFEELYHNHLFAVRRTVAAIVRNRHEVPDVVQESFTRALDRLRTLRDPERFRPWLLSIARHVATDRVREREPATSSEEKEAVELTAASGPGPAELAELADLSRLVRAGMAELSARDATAVALVTHLGFTPAKVAAALGVSQGAAKVIVHRARRRLRAALLLELLVRGPGRGCPDRPPLGPDGDRAEALRHVLGCPECMDTLTSDVRGYEMRPASPATSSSALARSRR